MLRSISKCFQTIKKRSPFTARGRERQATRTDGSWSDLWPLSASALTRTWPPSGGSGAGGGTVHKKKGPLDRLRQGAVSRKRPVLTGRGGESEARPRAPACIRAERSVKTKRPPALWAGGLENPAATYSPGPVGQVPSAMRGLTSVFGKGTGMTPSR